MGARTFVNNRLPSSLARNWKRGVDIPLLLALVALLVFGLIMLYSASYDFSFIQFDSPTFMFTRQLKSLAIGILMMIGLSLFDYHKWRSVVLVAMLGTIGLLIAVLLTSDPESDLLVGF
jgi:cell division protein FtsW